MKKSVVIPHDVGEARAAMPTLMTKKEQFEQDLAALEQLPFFNPSMKYQ
jgi:hypothetical protein